MINPEDVLQSRLARLEAGEPLEAVLGDLPEAEAGLLRLAADLRALPQPERSAEVVADQRQKLLRAAQVSKWRPLTVTGARRGQPPGLAGYGRRSPLAWRQCSFARS